MIISNNHKFIFIHIHKAAGTSIKFAIEKWLSWDDVIIGGTPFGEQIQKPYYNKYSIHKHSSALDVMELIGKQLWSECYSFAFVRNPYRRAISLYNYFDGLIKAQGLRRYLRHLPVRRYQSGIWRWPGITAYLESGNFSAFIRHERFSKIAAMKPQYQSTVDDDGKMIVDFIGKVETIEQDFQKVMQRIGLPELNLMKKNKSKSMPLQDYSIKESDYEYLYKLFERDFALFDYDPKYRF